MSLITQIAQVCVRTCATANRDLSQATTQPVSLNSDEMSPKLWLLGPCGSTVRRTYGSLNCVSATPPVTPSRAKTEQVANPSLNKTAASSVAASLNNGMPESSWWNSWGLARARVF